MLKIRKDFNVKIVSLTVSVVFLCNTTLYAYPGSEDSLRPHVGVEEERAKELTFKVFLEELTKGQLTEKEAVQLIEEIEASRDVLILGLADPGKLEFEVRTAKELVGSFGHPTTPNAYQIYVLRQGEEIDGYPWATYVLVPSPAVRGGKKREQTSDTFWVGVTLLDTAEDPGEADLSDAERLELVDRAIAKLEQYQKDAAEGLWPGETLEIRAGYDEKAVEALERAVRLRTELTQASEAEGPVEGERASDRYADWHAAVEAAKERLYFDPQIFGPLGLSPDLQKEIRLQNKAYVWWAIFKRIGLEKTARVLELMPGWSLSIPLALALDQHEGVYEVVDMAEEAISAQQEGKFKRLYPTRYHRTTLVGFAGDLSEPDRFEVVVANHIVDDFFISLAMRARDLEASEYYKIRGSESSGKGMTMEQQREVWDEIIKNAHYYKEMALGEAYNIARCVEPGGVVCIYQYPSASSLEFGHYRRIEFIMDFYREFIAALEDAGLERVDFDISEIKDGAPGVKYPEGLVILRKTAGIFSDVLNPQELKKVKAFIAEQETNASVINITSKVKRELAEMQEQAIPVQRFRELTHRVEEKLVEEVLNSGRLSPENTIILLPWRGALSFAPLFRKKGYTHFWHLGINRVRDMHTQRYVVYYENLPSGIDYKDVNLVIADPVLASGRTVTHAIEEAIKLGVSPENIIICNIVSAPEGIGHENYGLLRKYPEITIYTGSTVYRRDNFGWLVDSGGAQSMGDFAERWLAAGDWEELAQQWETAGVFSEEDREVFLAKMKEIQPVIQLADAFTKWSGVGSGTRHWALMGEQASGAGGLTEDDTPITPPLYMEGGRNPDQVVATLQKVGRGTASPDEIRMLVGEFGELIKKGGLSDYILGLRERVRQRAEQLQDTELEFVALIDKVIEDITTRTLLEIFADEEWKPLKINCVISNAEKMSTTSDLPAIATFLELGWLRFDESFSFAADLPGQSDLRVEFKLVPVEKRKFNIVAFPGDVLEHPVHLFDSDEFKEMLGPNTIPVFVVTDVADEARLRYRVGLLKQVLEKDELLIVFLKKNETLAIDQFNRLQKEGWMQSYDFSKMISVSDVIANRQLIQALAAAK